MKKYLNKTVLIIILATFTMGIIVNTTGSIIIAKATNKYNYLTATSTLLSVNNISNATTPSSSPDGKPPNEPPPNGNPPDGTPPGNPPNNNSSNVISVTAVYNQKGQTVTKNNQTITATKSNQSCIIVANKGKFILTNSIVDKKSGDTTSEESSNFYGLNAAILAKSASTINISNCIIKTSSDGSNAVFATDKSTKIVITDSNIVTTKNSSRGLDGTYGGTIIAKNVNITTSGAHCAAIATDRGGATINVTGGTMKTAGEGSPGIYSTGNITVANAKLKATGSEAAVIEGKNSILLNNTNISGSKKCGVMLYQSFSGDAEIGTSKFTMIGGSLTAETGPLFYVTNTDSIVKLTNVKLSQNSNFLLKASADRWGSTGANGGIVSFNVYNQKLSGNIICDNISKIDLSLNNNSELKGAINTQNTAKKISISLDKTSKWYVTNKSFITVLTNSDKSLSNIIDNGNTIYYDKNEKENSWLAGKTITLKNGGKLVPYTR